LSAPFTISRAEAESWLRAAALGLDDMAMLAIKIGNAATFAAVGSVIEILDFSRRLITWPREARPDAHERRVRLFARAVLRACAAGLMAEVPAQSASLPGRLSASDLAAIQAAIDAMEPNAADTAPLPFDHWHWRHFPGSTLAYRARGFLVRALAEIRALHREQEAARASHATVVAADEVLVDVRKALGLVEGESTIEAVRKLVAERDRLDGMVPTPHPPLVVGILGLDGDGHILVENLEIEPDLSTGVEVQAKAPFHVRGKPVLIEVVVEERLTPRAS